MLSLGPTVEADATSTWSADWVAEETALSVSTTVVAPASCFACATISTVDARYLPQAEAHHDVPRAKRCERGRRVGHSRHQNRAHADDLKRRREITAGSVRGTGGDDQGRVRMSMSTARRPRAPALSVSNAIVHVAAGLGTGSAWRFTDRKPRYSGGNHKFTDYVPSLDDIHRVKRRLESGAGPSTTSSCRRRANDQLCATVDFEHLTDKIDCPSLAKATSSRFTGSPSFYAQSPGGGVIEGEPAFGLLVTRFVHGILRLDVRVSG